MRNAFPALALALAACATPPPPPPAPAAAPPAPALPSAPTEPAPGLRLPRDVVPTAYRIELDARPGKEAFSGQEEIDVQLAKARQTLWLDAKELQVQKAEVVQGGKHLPAKLLAPDADGQVALVVSEAVQPGPATLAFTWTAPYGHQNNGLYKVVTEGAPYLFTQFENISARTAFPCFDEPSFKAPMTLTLTVDAEDVAAANTPIEKEEPVPGGKRVRFAQTRPLPSYLYAWAIGTFDVVEGPTIPASAQRPQPVQLRGIATRGQGKHLQLALEEAPRLVLAEEAYFGLPYPWTKLDLVAVPDFEAGAMENPGLITFRSTILLLDPAHISLAQKRHLAVDEAHELAHQWFGDLVTLAWWDDIWLNESFATWMEHRAVAAVHPDYRMGLVQAEESSGAMRQDSLASARKIRQPIVKTGDIADAFDGITYAKGGAVIGMFERYMGPEAFQKGIHDYLLAHRDSTATADDVLTALGAASGKDIATPFRTFLDQPGVPLVQAELACTRGSATLQLSQTRYLPKGSQGNRDQLWQVPVCVRYARDGKPAEACTLLASKTGALPLAGKKCPAWVQPNADMAGYYRWTLPGKQLAALTRAPLGDLDRFATAGSIRAGYEASVIPAADALRALEPFARDAMPEVAIAYEETADDVLQHFADDAWRPAIRKKLGQVYAPALQELGLDRKPNDDGATQERRTAVVDLFATGADDPKVRAELAKRGRAYLGVGSDNKIHKDAVPAEQAALAVQMALAADPSLLQPTIARFLDETDEQVRDQLLRGLSGLTDPAQAAQVRAISLSPKARVNEVLDPYWVQSHDYRTRPGAWADFRKNFDVLLSKQGEDSRGYLPYVAGDPCTEAGAREIEAFFTPQLPRMPAGERTVKKVVEGVELCVARAEAQKASAQSYFKR